MRRGRGAVFCCANFVDNPAIKDGVAQILHLHGMTLRCPARPLLNRFFTALARGMALCWLAVAAPQALAATVPDCEAIAARIGAAEGLPAGLLPAISRIESGRKTGKTVHAWPWTLNHAGKGLFFETREEALAYLRKTVANGPRNIDVGCMQINNYWHGKHFTSLEAMIDPETNIRYAVRYLKELYRERGSWDGAVQRYHSPDPERGARYHRAFAAARGRMAPNPGGAEIMQVSRDDAAPVLTGREAMLAGGLFGMPVHIGAPENQPEAVATEDAYAALLALLGVADSEGLAFEGFEPELAATSQSAVLRRRWAQVEAFREMLAPH